MQGRGGVYSRLSQSNSNNMKTRAIDRDKNCTGRSGKRDESDSGHKKTMSGSYKIGECVRAEAGNIVAGRKFILYGLPWGVVINYLWGVSALCDKCANTLFVLCGMLFHDFSKISFSFSFPRASLSLPRNYESIHLCFFWFYSKSRSIVHFDLC
jgi:hypothetical protein